MTTKIKAGVIAAGAVDANALSDNSITIAHLNCSDGTNGQVLTTDGAGTLSFSTVSGTTINNNADNRIITGSGTANTLEGEANLTFDGSNLNLNATSPVLTIESGDSQDSKILFKEDGSNAVSLFYEGSAGTGTSNNLHIRRELGGSETNLVTFGLDGAVGIGTSNPSSKLEVAGASGSSSSFKLSGRPDWTSGDGQYNVGNIYGENLGAGVNTTRIKLDGDDVSGSMIFYTANSGTLTSAMFINNNQDITMSGKGAVKVPSGTRAERPSSPANGMVRYNTTDSEYEVYNSSTWKKLDTTTYSYSADFLVIAGGGGGGSDGSTSGTYGGGGGGAGGYRTSAGTSGGGASAETALTFETGTTYTITVGAGGAGGQYSSNNLTDGVQGSNSSIDSTIVSLGGGGGAGAYAAATSGGSGGGGATGGGGQAGTSGQGYAGADRTGNDVNGGGGGAGAVGTASNGGNGVASSITGSSVTRAGGGGGAANGTGGTGGGGDSDLNVDGGPAQAGTANTGGGGGASHNNNTAGGAAGGSGVVILKMPTAKYSGTTTGSPTVTTSGSNTILTYNSSGTYTA